MATNPTIPPLKDRIIPWYFVMFFAVVFIANAIMIWLAVGSFSGVVTDHAYEKGRDYNAVISAQAQQDALGWKSTLSFQDGALHFALQDAGGVPMIGAQITAYAVRPAQQGLDFALRFSEASDGTYHAPARFPAPGQWDITVDVIWKQHAYQMTQRLIAP